MAISLSESAAARVKTYMAQGQNAGLRLGVKPTGCSGWAYVIKMAETIEAEDRVFEDQGVKIIVDAKSLPFLEGARLNFVKQGLNEAFKIDNPNVTSECGCGESFSV